MGGRGKEKTGNGNRGCAHHHPLSILSLLFLFLLFFLLLLGKFSLSLYLFSVELQDPTMISISSPLINFTLRYYRFNRTVKKRGDENVTNYVVLFLLSMVSSVTSICHNDIPNDRAQSLSA